MSRAEVLAATGLGAATWNVRIRELLKSGKVIREGKGRAARYRVG